VDPFNCSSDGFHRERNPGELVCVRRGQYADHLPLQQLTCHHGGAPDHAYPAGAFNRVSDNMPNFEFTCTFCYAVTPLQVTSTNPPDGGTFSPPAPGDYQYDVNFNQAVDPASVETSDLTLTGNVGGKRHRSSPCQQRHDCAVHGVHFANGGSVTASIGAGAITATGCNGNAAFTGNYTVEGPGTVCLAAAAPLPTPGVRQVGVISQPTGNFTPWADVPSMEAVASSPTRSSMIRCPTRGQPSRPLTRMAT